MLKGKNGGVLSFNDLKTFYTEPAVPCGGMGMRRLALEEGCGEGRRAVEQSGILTVSHGDGARKD